MRTARIVLGCLVLVALAAACGGGDGPAVASPSSAFPLGPTGPTGATGPQPTGLLPTLAPGTFSSGEVSFQLSGGLEVETTISTLVSGVFAPPPGGMAVVWTAGGTDATTVGLGGTGFTGSTSTSAGLSLTITAQTPDGVASFLSSAGECTVTIDVAERAELAGSFACEDLEDPTGVVVDATGSFHATE